MCEKVTSYSFHSTNYICPVHDRL